MKFFTLEEAISKGVKIPLKHSGESQWGDNWKEEDYNYRLNMCDEIFYAIEGDHILGHLGVQEDTVRAVFVEDKYRGQGVAQGLYEKAFEVLGFLYSDDAREAADTYIWEKFKKKYKNIRYLADRDQYLFKN